MKWIAFKQGLNDIVRYSIDDNPDEVCALMYNSFISFLRDEIKPNDMNQLLIEIDKFKGIYIDCKTKSWEIFEESEDINSYKRDELIKLNSKQDTKSTLQMRVDKSSMIPQSMWNDSNDSKRLK